LMSGSAVLGLQVNRSRHRLLPGLNPGARIPARERRCRPTKVWVAGLIGDFLDGQTFTSWHVNCDA
ncbi:MAG TPA: hypothetical protein VNO35_13290, partial [Steroidobacteraceae bacterium]|nr:hypothetical protein [Steroidobacteraceae bacterium]